MLVSQVAKNLKGEILIIVSFIKLTSFKLIHLNVLRNSTNYISKVDKLAIIHIKYILFWTNFDLGNSKQYLQLVPCN